MRGAVTGANETDAHFIQRRSGARFYAVGVCRSAARGRRRSVPALRARRARNPSRHRSRPGILSRHQVQRSRWARPISTPRDANGRSRWAATASASAAWSPPPSSRITTPTASSGRFRLRRFKSCSCRSITRTRRFAKPPISSIESCKQRGVEVLLDDRDERPGRQVQGRRSGRHSLCASPSAPKDWKRVVFELRWRRDGKTEEIPVADARNKNQRHRERGTQA